MKRLLIMSGFAFWVFVVNAQGEKWDKKDDPVEIRVGADLANITGDPGYSSIGGIQIGIRTRGVNFSKNVSLGIGLEYSMQGGKSKSYEYIPGGEYGSSTSTTRLNYLNLPVVVRFQKNRHGFFAEAGVQPGLLLSAKRKGSSTTDVKAYLKKADVSIPVGAGYKFKNKIGIALRVAPGLMNINKDSEVKNRNFVASLTASYSL
jgi:hypothetical protein